jgi:hypothetical protein
MSMVLLTSAEFVIDEFDGCKKSGDIAAMEAALSRLYEPELEAALVEFLGSAEERRFFLDLCEEELLEAKEKAKKDALKNRVLRGALRRAGRCK